MRALIPLWRLPRHALVGLVRAYRLLLSPWVGQSCRFTPTCSAYAITALQRHGAIIGTGLTGWRLLRCNPWCDGGCDEVPDNMPWRRHRSSPSPSSAAGLFTGLLHADPGTVPTAARACAAVAEPSNLSNPSS
jgi:putative membrane protein insertion efficiency factor